MVQFDDYREVWPKNCNCTSIHVCGRYLEDRFAAPGVTQVDSIIFLFVELSA